MLDPWGPWERLIRSFRDSSLLSMNGYALSISKNNDTDTGNYRRMLSILLHFALHQHFMMPFRDGLRRTCPCLSPDVLCCQGLNNKCVGMQLDNVIIMLSMPRGSHAAIKRNASNIKCAALKSRPHTVICQDEVRDERYSKSETFLHN